MPKRKKHTFVLDADLMKKVKKLAIDLDITVSHMIEDALKEYVKKLEREKEKKTK